MTYAFTHMGNFLLLLLSAIGIWALGLRFRPWGWDLALWAGILVLKLGFGPQGWILCLRLGFRLFLAEIWALRLGFDP